MIGAVKSRGRGETKIKNIKKKKKSFKIWKEKKWGSGTKKNEEIIIMKKSTVR